VSVCVLGYGWKRLDFDRTLGQGSSWARGSLARDLVRWMVWDADMVGGMVGWMEGWMRLLNLD
jgi:hypothetical protein